jgi:AcrR family transcriptional regulator
LPRMSVKDDASAALSRRTALLDAAIAVLADGGSRALTHRAVDRHLGLSLGSTANHFATRGALLLGVGERLLELDLTMIGPIPKGPVTKADAADLISEQLVAWLSPEMKRRQVAHLELVLLSSRDVRLQAAVALARTSFTEAAAQVLAASGCRSPTVHAFGLVALYEGLYIDQLLYAETPADQSSLRDHLERFLNGC